jgi:hypothetical protein
MNVLKSFQINTCMELNSPSCLVWLRGFPLAVATPPIPLLALVGRCSWRRACPLLRGKADITRFFA